VVLDAAKDQHDSRGERQAVRLNGPYLNHKSPDTKELQNKSRKRKRRFNPALG
jgi:hypothetical protein